MDSHFEDAIDDAAGLPADVVGPGRAPSGRLVGFAMISDGIPAEILAARDDIVGPYYLWRLLIDERRQGKGYGTATLDAVVDYVRTRPDADMLLDELQPGPDGPQPFYLGYGFRDTGTIMWDEEHLLRSTWTRRTDERSTSIPRTRSTLARWSASRRSGSAG